VALADDTWHTLDIVSLALTTAYAVLVLVECKMIELPQSTLKDRKARLSMKAILMVLKPYFWPDATASSATLNRIRALATWVFVILSKACGILAPIYIGRASTALTRMEYPACIRNVVWFCLLTLASAVCKEGQSLVYLRVAQAAFVQLAELSFRHLHSLSLDWHLKKKLGEVIRSMDRGILACDTLIKYLFLWLIPAVAECILVVVIFATYFNYLPLAVTVFYFVFAYMLLTVLLTLWRKKFRKQVAKSDNDWHDIATDSLVNFETVKYFTSEDFEMKKFGSAVEAFQKGSVNVAASLSMLNISQRVLLQACLATSLSLAALAIKDRMDCCVNNGCSDFNSDCCSNLSDICPGMEIGDFVSVLTYTINLFTPLNFLGSVYNAIVMAIVDLTNLSELLAENPDVTDAKDAIALPKTNLDNPDAVVEFDNVKFHYPTQPESSGLKGVTFKMKRGTTTAIVGSTGAGKTTISRLLFRFYDVTGGAIKVNGADVRTVKQKDLRDMIGVVPQTATLFNDTFGANIAYGKPNATQAEIEEAAQAAQLMTFVESLPEKWNTLVGDRGLKLSGGERQRCAIARCLLKK
jgi:ABC-type transport system involved in Fe-S cluster assembly fused permease/ATPase subunit